MKGPQSRLEAACVEQFIPPKVKVVPPVALLPGEAVRDVIAAGGQGESTVAGDSGPYLRLLNSKP